MTYDLLPDTGHEWREFRVGQGILVRSEQVLLCSNRWYSDRPPVWTLPGGRAEPGESMADALVREYAEETGLEISVGRLAYVAEARSLTSKRLFLTCAFVVSELGGTLSIEGDPSIEEARFVPFSDLPGYLHSPSLATPLVEYFKEPDAPARYWFFPDYAPPAGG